MARKDEDARRVSVKAMNRSHGLDTSRYIAVTSRNGVRDRA
jgi:hypothetical protein